MTITSPSVAADDPARLARDVVPTLESIRLDLDPAQKSYKGTATIELKVNAPSESFRFHARDMSFTRVSLRQGKAEVPIKAATGEIGLVTVRAAKALTPGTATLVIDFTKDYSTRAASFYRVEAGGHAYVFTDFEPDDARGAWPCWDEPSFKIPWQITVTIPKEHSAYSNTLPERDEVTGERRTVVFKRTVPLSSYLVALIAGPFDSVPIDGLSVPGRVVAVKGSAYMGAQAAKETPAIVKALERYFGHKYPYDKLDLLAVPEFTAGAMENAAAITYRETILLLDPKTMSAAQRYRVISTTAHEVSHMWFGDLVTMEWWDDLWLNESFASWMGDKITDEVAPEFHAGNDQVGEMLRAMVVDSRLTTRAMRAQLKATDNLTGVFDLLSYQKGQAILTMLERWLGEEKFRDGVRAYIAAHAEGNATAADLWAALSKAAGHDVGAVAGSFLDQPGVPIVTVETLGGSKVKLSQRRFVSHGSARPSQLWKIPVTLRYAVGERTFTQNVLLSEASQTVELQGGAAPGWIHPNADELGYYRWSVPASMLAGLANGATSKLSVRERVGFVGNLRALLLEGQVRGDQYFGLLAAFGRDPEPEVIAAVVEALQQSRNPFVTPATRPAFASYVRQVLTPALDRFGLEPKKEEPQRVTVLRPSLMLIMAADGNDPRVLEKGRALATAYMKDPALVDPSIQEVSLSIAALQGDAALFDTYRTRFESAATPTERARYLNAFSYFTDPAMAKKSLEYAASGKLRPQEIVAVGQFMAAFRPELQDMVFQWTVDHYDYIASHIPPGTVPNLPRSAAGCSLERISRAREFFAQPAHSPVGTSQELDRIEAGVQECAALHEREAETAAKAWASKSSGGSAPVHGLDLPNGR
jgi:alanyl aminopeptidase